VLRNFGFIIARGSFGLFALFIPLDPCPFPQSALWFWRKMSKFFVLWA